jgi:hypothetical protein
VAASPVSQALHKAIQGKPIVTIAPQGPIRTKQARRHVNLARRGHFKINSELPLAKTASQELHKATQAKRIVTIVSQEPIRTKQARRHVNLVRREHFKINSALPPA